MFPILKKLRDLKNTKRAQPFKGLTLPSFRTNQGLSDNETYLVSGVEQLNFLKAENLMCEKTKMLDFGCGQGRMVNSMVYSNTLIHEYTGIDTDKRSVKWCKKYLSGYGHRYRFIHLPAYNARYNTTAKGLKELPFTRPHFDLVFLNSVFSHMLQNDVIFYLKEFHRILKNDGFIYSTAFIEENVPKITENPKDYVSTFSGALHCVRYEKNHFFSLVDTAQFKIHKFFPRQIQRTQQSVIVLIKK